MNALLPAPVIHWNIQIPLRDGTQLTGTLYDIAQVAPGPCVVLMTPYVADTHHERGTFFARRGLRLLIVDVRGRGNSQGSFEPFVNEGHDGHDVVQWVASQSFCNGDVGMCGGSYLGFCQWAAAAEQPSALRTIVPAAAPYVGISFPKRSNIYLPFAAQWLLLTSGKARQQQIFSDRQLWSEIFRHWFELGQAFVELGAWAGSGRHVFEGWLEHPDLDQFWHGLNPSPAQYAKIDLPILTITGIYDDDQPGALEHYRRHMGAKAGARPDHFLVIGPWNHGGAGWTADKEYGGLNPASECDLDLRQLHADWFSWTFGTGARPAFLQRQVAYYVMGLEQWKFADDLDEITAHRQETQLDSTANANGISRSGTLAQRGASGAPDCYTYDPRVCAAEAECEAAADGASLVDQSLFVALEGRILAYDSERFELDTEICGFFRLSLWLAIDCPDTDVYISVHEVFLDGRTLRLSTDALRARYRSGPDRGVPISTDRPLRYDFENFTFVSRLVRRGHRLRLIVSPMGRLLDVTFAERNFNAGGRVAHETIADALPVTVRLFHDGDHPSFLSVPIGQADAFPSIAGPELG